MKKRGAYSGFTLIELLVVIAIILILAAILFPIFAAARERAVQNNCLSNLKNIGMGLSTYNREYEETLCPSYLIFPGNIVRNWSVLVQPYIKSDKIVRCPASPGVNPGYGMNTNFASPQTLSNASLPCAVIRSTADTICLVDANSSSSDPDPNTNTYGYVGFTGRTVTGGWAAVPRHQEGANCLFFDGHAKFFKLQLINNYPVGDERCMYDNIEP